MALESTHALYQMSESTPSPSLNIGKRDSIASSRSQNPSRCGCLALSGPASGLQILLLIRCTHIPSPQPPLPPPGPMFLQVLLKANSELQCILDHNLYYFISHLPGGWASGLSYRGFEGARGQELGQRSVPITPMAKAGEEVLP